MTDLEKLLAEATPGPWHFDGSPMSRRTRYITRRDGRTIGAAHSLGFLGSNELTLRGRAQSDANARLIALAPELAFALLVAEMALEKARDHYVTMNGGAWGVLNEALAEIAKLMGGRDAD